MNTPKCCEKTMELKTVTSISVVGKIGDKYFFQCDYCGKIKTRSLRWE